MGHTKFVEDVWISPGAVGDNHICFSDIISNFFQERFGHYLVITALAVDIMPFFDMSL
jgi:hypothetical protein